MSEIKADIPTHILIRVRSEDGKTINAHREMIAANGAAVFGKIGKGLGIKAIKELNGQLSNDVETYLFLTTREGWNGPYVTYQCHLKSIGVDLSETRVDLMPKYYSHEAKNIKTWFEISSMERMTKSEMNHIFVKSSGRAIMSVVKSSATVFKVGLKSSNDSD